MTRNEILSTLKENRDSIISEINWCFRFELKAGEVTLKDIMEKVVAFAEQNQDYFDNPKRIKTNMRCMVKKISANFHREKEEAFNMKAYGKKNPSLSEMQARYEEANGTSLYAEWHMNKFGVATTRRF